jgi:hypothetical protein
VKLCPACDRHLFGPAPACPFCGAAQATTAAHPSGTAVASVTLALALATAACGPLIEPEETQGSSDTGEDTSPPLTTTTIGTTTTTTVSTGPTTVSTDDGPAMTSIDMTSADGDTTDDSVGSFYAVRPDGSEPAIECDLFAQDCPLGEKCMPWANDGGNTWNAARCTPLDPDPDAPGEPCTVEGSAVSGIDSCDIGVMCFDVDPRTNEGTCVAMCTGSPEVPLCTAPEQACLIANDGVIVLCFDVCDPLAPACDADMGCYPSDAGDQFFCLPTIDMPGTYGDSCEGIVSCAPGHVCLDAAAIPGCAGAACCTELCDTTAGLPCPDDDVGVVCQPWYEDGMAPPGLEAVGVCVLPA